MGARIAPCRECAEYLRRRHEVLGPEVAREAARRGLEPARLLTSFMRGVHARHTSGKPLS